MCVEGITRIIEDMGCLQLFNVSMNAGKVCDITLLVVLVGCSIYKNVGCGGESAGMLPALCGKVTQSVKVSDLQVNRTAGTLKYGGE